MLNKASIQHWDQLNRSKMRIRTFFGLAALFAAPHITSTEESGLELVETFPKAYDEILYGGDQNICPQKTICTILDQCRLLQDLMDRSCLIPSKLKELTCGYRGTEVMICCPISGNVSPFGPNYHHPNYNPPKNVTSFNELNKNCGRPQVNGWKNGYSGVGSHPWVARIGFKAEEREDLNYPCCGSIITNKVVLTAAHCALAELKGYSLHSVRVGDYDGSTDPDCSSTFCTHPAQDLEISHVVVHPGYEKGVYKHDLALVNLNEPIVYSVAARPICLLQNPAIPLIGRRGKLIGWGKLAGQTTAPQKQQQIDLPVVPLRICSKLYGRILPITSNHLCVGGEAQKDACSGFGGAPLVMLDHINKDAYYQVGMVSFGSDRCGVAGIPSVYTRIERYYDWISDNIQV